MGDRASKHQGAPSSPARPAPFTGLLPKQSLQAVELLVCVALAVAAAVIVPRLRQHLQQHRRRRRAAAAATDANDELQLAASSGRIIAGEPWLSVHCRMPLAGVQGWLPCLAPGCALPCRILAAVVGDRPPSAPQRGAL